MNKNNGGPAFPCQELGTQHATEQMDHGMSLRDWFAGQATDADIEDMQNRKPSGIISRQMARYMHADAMLAERNAESRDEKHE